MKTLARIDEVLRKRWHHDIYAVKLGAEVTYIIDPEGSATDAGMLANPLLRWPPTAPTGPPVSR